ncbi:hypothetical protein SAMN05421821_12072 [Mucilaginibacter lappiensis]|uniref:Uncharacterized protein n=1 Tax=Mucilaginibacter lappiensis TaxID=354630 RepID=A0A1N7FXA5_9SPHI|nr:hypothetical protein [Mucilaginibacter lappiensis]MBB6126655.1 hypothetical protein [Mucilaginibacter lappiensis]SIS04988.1 hypothetical protein SAMN05421821_12072 [Mucilaginibacter lappiensis]
MHLNPQNSPFNIDPNTKKMNYLPYFCAKLQVQHDYGIQSIITLRKADFI